MLLRRWWPVAGVLLAVVGGATDIVYHHVYAVSMFAPWALPARVHVCGRNFRVDESSRAPDRRAVDMDRDDSEPFAQIGEFGPPLHVPMKIFGRAGLAECGMVVLVGPDEDHLGSYTLQGGP